ncbi:MAG: PIN domain-containing protein [Flavobacteriales bacterium]|nr:MAG: PIN domain-containing protein [Flavobacteriales bacterium]
MVLAALKDHAVWKQAQVGHALGADDALVMISTVTMAELLSLAEQNGWGASKKEKLEKLLRRYVVIDISHNDLPMMEAYARIDAFSQGKLVGVTLGLSSRNMGKNDLWIAATAAITKAKLLTTDADFDHLKGAFLDLDRVRP